MSSPLTGENNIFSDRYSARAIAIGNVFTPLADDSSAVFYNPAGVGQFYEKSSFNSMYADVHNLGLIKSFVLSGAVKFKEDIGMGGGWVYERVNLEPEIWGQHRLFYSLSYELIDSIYVGASPKLLIITTDFPGYENVLGYGINFGFLVTSESWDVALLKDNDIGINAGVLVEDVFTRIEWQKEYDEKVPYHITLGFNLDYDEKINAGIHFKTLKENITTFGLGCELYLLSMIGYDFGPKLKIEDIVLRAGMETENIVSSGTFISGGFGIISEKFSFDYAILYQADYFAATHYFSLNFTK